MGARQNLAFTLNRYKAARSKSQLITKRSLKDINMVWVIDFRKDKKLLILIGKTSLASHANPKSFFTLLKQRDPVM